MFFKLSEKIPKFGLVDYAKEKYVFVTDSTSNIIVSDYFISAYTAYASLFSFSIVLITDSSSNIDP